MIDNPFDEQGQKFARSYSQIAPGRDSEQRKKQVLQTALAPEGGIAKQGDALGIPGGAVSRAAANIVRGGGAPSRGALEALGPVPGGSAFQGAVGLFGGGGGGARGDRTVGQASEYLQNAYREHLGRDASPEEIQSQLRGQGLKSGDRFVRYQGLNNVISSLASSPEAQALTASRQREAPSNVPPGGMPNVPVSNAQYANKLEGFDAGNLQTSDTPKYQVARIFQKYPPTREGLQAAVQEINQLGIGTAEVFGNDGDKIRFSGSNLDPRFQDVTEFDVLRAIDGNGVAQGWQWMGLNGSAASPTSPSGPAFAPVSLNPNVSASSPESARDYLNQILAAVQGNPALKRALSGTL